MHVKCLDQYLVHDETFNKIIHYKAGNDNTGIFIPIYKWGTK